MSPDEEKEDNINDVLNKSMSKSSFTTSWRWQKIIFLHIQTQTSYIWGHRGPSLVHCGRDSEIIDLVSMAAEGLKDSNGHSEEK